MYTSKFVESGAKPIRPPFKTLHKFSIDVNGVVRMTCVSKNLHGGGVAVNKQAFDWMTGGGLPGTPISKMEIRLINAITARSWEGTVEMFPRFPTWEEGEWGTYTIIDEDWDGWCDRPRISAVPAAEALADARAQEAKSSDFAASTKIILVPIQDLDIPSLNPQLATMERHTRTYPNDKFIIENGVTRVERTLS